MQYRLKKERLEKTLALDREVRLEELRIKEAQGRQELKIKEKELTFNISTASSLIPSFDEGDIEGSFDNFEHIATKNEWPKEEWMSVIAPKLTGKSYRIYINLDRPDDYDFVKKQLLSAYAVTPESYREKFRKYSKPKYQTYIEFANEKLKLFKKWLKALEVTTFSDLINLIVLEEFKNKVPFPIVKYIEEKGERNLLKVAELSDAQALRLETWARQEEHSSFVKTSSGENPPKDTKDKPRSNVAPDNQLICAYCRKPGHSIASCRHPKCRASKILTGSGPSGSQSKTVAMNSNVKSSSASIFDDFIFQGQVSLTKNDQFYHINILRDTGAAQSILLSDALPNINQAFTGEKVLISDLTSNASYPLAQICLKCPLLDSPVKVAVRAGTLPVKGVQLLLGNDLAGKQVVPNVVTVEQPLPTVDHDPSDVFPLCAVTRSQAQKLAQTPTSSRLPSTPLIPDLLTKEQLINSQETDPSLATVRHVASDKKDLDTLPAFYYDQGVLMRAYRPSTLSSSDSWSETHQIVLPTSVRHSVLKLAHDSSGGHLGFRKTYQKVLAHFFWPGIKSDVNNFVKTCDVCQRYGKVNQPIPPAPLYSIPVVHEPFEKIIIDCVGPLPKTKRGNQYLLTVMDSTTRYPEAFPLKNITAKGVLKPLLHMFTSKGIPKQIQSDQGTNFTSTTFKQVLAELGVEHVTSSAYHPQSQGCLERFHQTLKQVLGKYCHENGTTWDDHLDWLLFAYRESLQESLGFSPFEVLYGRNVRGPLKVLKEKWFESQSQPVTVQEYVSSLMDKLTRIRNFAKQNLQHSQMK